MFGEIRPAICGGVRGVWGSWLTIAIFFENGEKQQIKKTLENKKNKSKERNPRWISPIILLMAEIRNNHLGCMKPYK